MNLKVMDESCAEGMELLRMAAAGDSGFTLEDPGHRAEDR